jgi:formylglycine-generating enzyme required for sulfatase activity
MQEWVNISEMKEKHVIYLLLAVILLLGSCMKDMPDSLNGYTVNKGVKGSGTEPTPENKVLKASVENLSFSNYPGNQSFDITSNVSWRAVCDADWVTVTESTTRGTGNGTVTVSVKHNNETKTRTTTIIISSNDAGSVKVNITQSGTTPVGQSEMTFTVNGIPFKMIHVEGGTFMMGATSEQGSDAADDEKPAHQVTLSSYYMGETEVTQEMWQAVMGSNPPYFSGSQKPLDQVSWDECQTFITKLNSLTGQRFRLPTEAEWEFAARGGNQNRGYKFAGGNTIDNVAWYRDNSNSQTHNVGTKRANELGLYDMSGNVEEWCQDWYGSYSSSSQTNPTGPSSGYSRVIRGGSRFLFARGCRVSIRSYYPPDSWFKGLGLRLAL